jgi:acetyltransferase EpsM
MKNKLIIIGAGGHGKVAAEAAMQSGDWVITGFCDEKIAVGTKVIDDLTVITNLANIKNAVFDYFFIAIGDNKIRKEIFEKLRPLSAPATITHPFSSISKHAGIGEGSIILPGAVISHGVKIGDNCIIGSNVHIDHESVIGEHSHIRNGSTIGSNCILDPESETPAGASLQPFSHPEKKK